MRPDKLTYLRCEKCGGEQDVNEVDSEGWFFCNICAERHISEQCETEWQSYLDYKLDEADTARGSGEEI